MIVHVAWLRSTSSFESDRTVDFSVDVLNYYLSLTVEHFRLYLYFASGFNGECRKSSEPEPEHRARLAAQSPLVASLPLMALTSPSSFLPALPCADFELLSHHLENLSRIYASDSWPLEVEDCEYPSL